MRTRPIPTLLGLFLLLGVGVVKSCDVNSLGSCDTQYNAESTEYQEKVKVNNYTDSEKAEMTCRIAHGYANCSYAKVDGCVKTTVSQVDSFFTRYSSCNIPDGASRGITILPDPPIPPERQNGTCDMTAVGECVNVNGDNIRDLIDRFRTGLLDEATQKSMLCAEGERFAACMYSNSMGCSDTILQNVDTWINKYNEAPFECGLVGYLRRYLNGTVAPVATTTSISTASPLTSIGSTDSTTFAPSTPAPDPDGTQCLLNQLQVCDDQFVKDSKVYQEAVSSQNFTADVIREMFCKLLHTYANCTYPKIHSCYKKTHDYVNSFFNQYPTCSIATSLQRGIPYRADPTVPPERRDGKCDVMAVNDCMTSNQIEVANISTQAKTGTLTVDQQKQLVCNEGQRFATCLYGNTMGCTNDYLATVDQAIDVYNGDPFFCGIVGYVDRDVNGTADATTPATPTTATPPTTNATTPSISTSGTTPPTTPPTTAPTTPPTTAPTTQPTTNATTPSISTNATTTTSKPTNTTKPTTAPTTTTPTTTPIITNTTTLLITKSTIFTTTTARVTPPTPPTPSPKSSTSTQKPKTTSPTTTTVSTAKPTTPATEKPTTRKSTLPTEKSTLSTEKSTLSTKTPTPTTAKSTPSTAKPTPSTTETTKPTKKSTKPTKPTNSTIAVTGPTTAKPVSRGCHVTTPVLWLTLSLAAVLSGVFIPHRH